MGCAHHVTQRGNNRQDVLSVDEDQRVYRELLQEQAQKYGPEILAYCLMTDDQSCSSCNQGGVACPELRLQAA